MRKIIIKWKIEKNTNDHDLQIKGEVTIIKSITSTR